MGSFVRVVSLLGILGVAGGLLGLPVAAQMRSAGSGQASPRTLQIPRVTRAPKLEDFLNGTPREAEAALTDFRQFRPGDGVAASEPTRAYLSYDDKNLYVVFVCKDDPAKVRAHLAKREDIGNDEQVAVYLDTFRDRRRAYVFATNPLGVQLDAIFTEGQGYDFSFDTLWYSEGRLLPDGYIVWMAIPFKSLRFPNEPMQAWGVALNRVIIRTNEVVFWPFLTQRVEGLTQQFATLEGLERISPAHNIQLIPYGLFARARFLDTVDPNQPRFRTENDFRGGLDAKLVARDALTFDFTLNPDFSQVESDEPQVTINQRFEVFFPEKRPFFIENAGFFQTPITLFFSRRAVDPQLGARMTGKVGRWALGGLVMDDRAPGKNRLSTDPLRGERAGIGVVRGEREFGQQSKLGFFVASRDFAASSNRVFSLDTRIKFSPNLVLEAQAMRSYTRQLPNEQACQKEGQRLSGPAYWTELRYSGRHSSYAGNYNDRSPDFCSQLGFVPRVDIRQTEQFAGYFWRPEGRRIIAFGPAASALVNWDHAGRLQDWSAAVSWEVNWTGQTTLTVSRGEAFELFQNIGFRKRSTAVAFSTEWLKWLTLSARYSQGTGENFFPAASLPPFLANAARANLGFTFRPSPRLRFDQTYIYARLGTRAGSTPPGFPSGISIFNNHILRSKLNYQFNRELSLRAILDYNATLANPGLLDVQTNLGGAPGGPLVPTKRFNTDLLLTYLLHPGTAVYVGYTDRQENLALDSSSPPMLRRISSPTTATGRQIFVKVSYLFRF